MLISFFRLSAKHRVIQVDILFLVLLLDCLVFGIRVVLSTSPREWSVIVVLVSVLVTMEVATTSASSSFVVALIFTTIAVVTTTASSPSEPATSSEPTTSLIVVVEAAVATSAHRVALLHVVGSLHLGRVLLNFGDALLIDFEVLDGPFGLKRGCQSIKFLHPIFVLVLNVLAGKVLAGEPLLAESALIYFAEFNVEHFVLEILFAHVDLVLFYDVLDVHGTALEHVSRSINIVIPEFLLHLEHLILFKRRPSHFLRVPQVKRRRLRRQRPFILAAEACVKTEPMNFSHIKDHRIQLLSVVSLILEKVVRHVDLLFWVEQIVD